MGEPAGRSAAGRRDRGMCTKIKHDTPEGAERHRAQLEARDRREGAPSRPGHLNVYRCAECGGYHVGHSKRRRKDPV